MNVPTPAKGSTASIIRVNFQLIEKMTMKPPIAPINDRKNMLIFTVTAS